MAMEPRRREEPRNWAARVLAPLALAATALTLVAVITTSLDGKDSEEPERQPSEPAAVGCQPAADKAVAAGYYVIEAEDTAGLSAVADKTCIEVAELTELNPNLDPQQLVVGNCVDLVVDGCKALAEG